MTSHLVVALSRPSLARTAEKGGMEPRLVRPSLSPVLSFARYLLLSFTLERWRRVAFSLFLSRCSSGGAPHFHHSVYAHNRGARLARDTAEINMATASILSKRGSFAFFSVYLVRTPRRALSIPMLVNAPDLNYLVPYARLGAS